MDLFEILKEEPDNLLYKEGLVYYYRSVIPSSEADTLFYSLLNNIEWKNDEVFVFGKHIITRRKVAWYGDKSFKYTYSNKTKQALSWTPELKALKSLVEMEVNETFNSCLLNLYHDGSEGMGWHSDDEDDLKKNGTIASLSLGAERKFSFKHKKSKQTVSITLENGSLLVMKGVTQKHWLHCLPATKKTDKPRVNLTFRTILH